MIQMHYQLKNMSTLSFIEKQQLVLRQMSRIFYLGGFELPDKNAAAQRVLSNARLLRSMGHNITFVGISKDIKNAPIEVDGFESRPVPYPTCMMKWIHHVCTFINSDFVINSKPDYVVMYNFPAIASLRIMKTCHKNGVKVIHDVTEWEANKGWTPGVIIRKIDVFMRMRYCMKRMDGVIAISKFLYEYYKTDVNTILVPPTVDLEDPKWNRVRKLTVNSPITLIYAGTPGGGVKDRLDLIVDEVRNYQNIRLIVVGITDEQFYGFFNRQKEIIANVEFKGRLPHVEAVKAVCDADFQMLIRDHNRKNDAGFPTKLVESMSCGTPVIATVFSNITDYVKDGVNGFLVKGDSTLGTVLKRVSVLSSEEIISMKQNCINMKDFDYRSYQEEFGELFK